MKTEKIEQMIIKDYHYPGRITYGKYNDNVVVIPLDATVCYMIPYSIFPFDFAKISKGKIYLGSVEKLFDNKDYSKARFEEFKVAKSKKILIKFTNGSECVYIDVKLFDLFENYAVYIADSKSPARIYEGDRLVGLVMPTCIEQKEDKND